MSNHPKGKANQNLPSSSTKEGAGCDTGIKQSKITFDNMSLPSNNEEVNLRPNPLTRTISDNACISGFESEIDLDKLNLSSTTQFKYAEK